MKSMSVEKLILFISLCISEALGWVKNIHTLEFLSVLRGNDSMGFMQATPGEMKSFKSSADRIALMTTVKQQNDAEMVVKTSDQICEHELLK